MEELNQKLAVLLFDLDDTLIPSSQFYLQARTQMGLNEEEYQTARKMVKATLKKESPSVHNRLLYFKKILENRGQFSASSLLNMNEMYEANLLNLISSFVQQSRHTKVLHQLAKNHRLGIVTNETTRIQILKLQQIDPKGEIFSFIVTSEEIGQEKPSPLIYDEVIKRIGTTVLPAQIAMIGDDLTADIVPATERGWRAFWVTEFVLKDKIQPLPESAEMIESICDLPYKI